MKLVAIIFSTIFFYFASAQIQVTYFTREDLLEDFIIGEGIYTNNVQYSGSTYQFGHYDGTAENFEGITGMVLSTGRVYDDFGNGIVGPNDYESNGTDLQGFSMFNTAQMVASAAGVYASVFDPCILEFDMISVGDTLYSSFIFGSEEYPEFVESEFNDFFAIILENKSTGQKTNLAALPQTNTVVSVNTINNGVDNSGPCDNCEYYINNGNGSQSPYNSSNAYLQMDGFTRRITAKTEISSGQEYHVIIALMDVSDHIYDSNLFFEYSSFSTNEAVLSSDDNTFQNMVVFPNPVSEVLNIDGVVSDDNIILQNVAGKGVKNLNSEKNSWDISSLAEGIYFIRIERKGRVELRKIIKK